MTPFDDKCQNLQMFLTPFRASSHRLRDTKTLNFKPSKSRSRSRSIIFKMTPFDDKCPNLQISPTHFCASSYHFGYMQICNCLPSKSRSNGVQFSHLRHSMANVKIFKRHGLHVLFSLRYELCSRL